jgi:hypothetical protein
MPPGLHSLHLFRRAPLSLSPFAADGDTEGGARGSAGLDNGTPPTSSPADTAPAR